MATLVTSAHGFCCIYDGFVNDEQNIIEDLEGTLWIYLWVFYHTNHPQAKD
jgi:hypothetical protein